MAGTAPVLAIFFVIASLALAGIPPLSGFYSKFGLILSGLSAHHPWLVTAALVTSLFTLYSMIKIWRLGFWGKQTQKQGNGGSVLVACGLSVILVLLLSIFAGPVMKISKEAGDQLLERNTYINAVMASKPTPQRNRS